MARRQQLVERRKALGWSQKDVVDKLKEQSGIEITVSYYGMIEQGSRTPKLDLALEISKLFQRAPGDIFFNQKPNKMLGA